MRQILSFEDVRRGKLSRNFLVFKCAFSSSGDSTGRRSFPDALSRLIYMALSRALFPLVLLSPVLSVSTLSFTTQAFATPHKQRAATVVTSRRPAQPVGVQRSTSNGPSARKEAVLVLQAPSSVPRSSAVRAGSRVEKPVPATVSPRRTRQTVEARRAGSRLSDSRSGSKTPLRRVSQQGNRRVRPAEPVAGERVQRSGSRFETRTTALKTSARRTASGAERRVLAQEKVLAQEAALSEKTEASQNSDTTGRASLGNGLAQAAVVPTALAESSSQPVAQSNSGRPNHEVDLALREANGENQRVPQTASPRGLPVVLAPLPVDGASSANGAGSHGGGSGSNGVGAVAIQSKPADALLASAGVPQRVAVETSGGPVFALNSLRSLDAAGSIALDQDGNRVHLTIVPDLQLEAKALLQKNDLPWGALVALDPRSGKVLAMSSYSSKEPYAGDIATRATFPAASLFKLVTAAAVIEQSGLDGSHTIFYRGGDYTLVRQNAIPDPRKDRRKITFAEALGRSVNPAFAHVALNTISESTLERYAHSLGFNQRLPFDAPIDVSHFERPGDEYETARTAAGFGDVTLSPLHAAVLTATIANRGVMMKPYIVDHIVGVDGTLRYQSKQTAVRTALSRSTASELLSMMEATVDSGTAKRQFLKMRNPFLKSVPIAAKTGTLSGENPKGLYHWFVAAVPANNPEVVVAALIIESGGAVRIHCSGLARDFLEFYFRDHSDTLQTRTDPATPKATS